MSEVTIPTIRVRALQPKRRRAGIDFGREPVDVTAAQLGVGLAAVMALGAILTDPVLSVTIVEQDEDGEETERPVTEEERDSLTAFLEAESAKVDPEAPPTAEAAEAAAEAKAKDGAAPKTEPEGNKPKGRQPAAQATG